MSVQPATGDILSYASTTPPSGYLLCDGSYVPTATYPMLASAIGNSFSPITDTFISNNPCRNQYDFNRTQTATDLSFTTGTSLPGVFRSSSPIVTKNRVYLCGGYTTDATTAVSTVYTAPINSDGTLGSWTTSANLPGPFYLATPIVTKNRVYLVAGGTTGGGSVSTVYTAPINSDGTLGTWTTGPALPAAMFASQAMIVNSRVYLMGGLTSGTTTITTIYTAQINDDGTLGSWSSLSQFTLPTNLAGTTILQTKNTVYVIGGTNNGSANSANIYATSIRDKDFLTSDSWAYVGTIPFSIRLANVAIVNSRIYILGYWNAAGVASTASAPIYPNGTLGPWVVGTNLPVALGLSSVVITSSRIYLCGGATSTTVSTVLSAPFSGGKNDYMSGPDHYNYIPSTPDSGYFRLPDMSSTGNNNIGNMYAIIKT